MYGYANAARSYQTVQVSTAAPLALVITLYRAAISSISKAEQALEAKALVEAHNHLIKAQQILGELMSALNPEAGELADNLMSLYAFLVRRLAEANVKKDAAELPRLRGILENLLEAWEQLNKQPVAKQAAG